MREGASRSHALAALAAAIAASGALAGCGSDETRKVTVPVLWAAPQDNGQVQGGVEPAVVEVANTEDNPGFAVNLADPKAKGAGPQWEAASSSAAAIGTLASASSPRDISIAFEITGPIDGPSGGAGLTVGVMAAARDAELKEGVTITGTINPDGSIGPVGYIATKMRAADKAGYRTIVIPSAARMEVDTQSGREVDLVKLGRSLGMTVVPVEMIGQAYRAMTGRRFVNPPAQPATLSPAVAKVTGAQAREAVRQSGSALARRQLDGGDDAGAYGVAVDALKGAWQREAAALNAGEQREEAARLASRAEKVLAAAAAAPRLNPEEQATLPFALGPAVYGSALLAGLGSPEAASPDGETAAAQLAAARAAIELVSPDGEEVIGAYGPQPVKGDAARFLSGYTNFLIRAGKANLAYVDSVGASAGAGEAYLPAAKALEEIVDKTPPGENPISQEVIQSARAVTFFILTASLVSGVPVSESLPAAPPAQLDRSVQASARATGQLAAQLQGRGLDLGYPFWSSTWAAETTRELPGGGGADAAAQGYQQTAYAVIAALMLTAAVGEADGR